MARRSMVMTVALVIASLWSVAAEAATAPSNAPVLTSAPYAWPGTFHWTPGADPTNASQGVYRSSGVCTQPPAQGGPIQTGLPPTQTDFTAGPVDGIYCYTIRTVDLLGGTATSPGSDRRVRQGRSHRDDRDRRRGSGRDRLRGGAHCRHERGRGLGRRVERAARRRRRGVRLGARHRYDLGYERLRERHLRRLQRRDRQRGALDDGEGDRHGRQRGRSGCPRIRRPRGRPADRSSRATARAKARPWPLRPGSRSCCIAPRRARRRFP